jgi:8-amino-7-oxononanoate synthase
LRPIVVTDGLCPATGQPAPVAAYLEAIRRFEGYLVMDDTQALGILGAHAGPGIPYGSGGGGTLRWAGIRSANAVVVSSLAKGLGVPVAMLGGDEALVRRFEEQSETRTHCSPPSAAVVNAAGNALALNAARGDALRRRLLQRVRQFRAGLARLRLAASGNLFPVQTLMPAPSLDPVRLHRGLRDRGVHTVLHRARAGQEPRLSFILTARHSTRDVEAALDLLADSVWSPQAEHSWG